MTKLYVRETSNMYNRDSDAFLVGSQKKKKVNDGKLSGKFLWTSDNSCKLEYVGASTSISICALETVWKRLL